MRNKWQNQAKTANQKRIYGKEPFPAPEAVTLTLPIAELIAQTRGVIEEAAGEIGLILMQECMKEEIRRMVGERYDRQEKRSYVRWGKQCGYVIFGGRKVPIKRLRARAVGSGREARLESYDAFRKEPRLMEAMMGKMLLGVSTRDYKASLEALCDGYGVARSSVSRHCIRATAARLDELMKRDLSKLDLAAIFIDGTQYAGQTVVIVLGVDVGGNKHVLGLRLGATENAVVVTELLESIVDRGLAIERPTLFVLDGAKALCKAARSLWGGLAVIQRCQVHKLRNVKEHLSGGHQIEASRRIRAAYAMTDHGKALQSLKTTARWLQMINPSVARSLEEGMEETLTVVRLGLPEMLRKTLSNTNCIENCISGAKRRTRNVKRWRHGAMIERWVGCALLEAEKGFRRIRGYRKMSFLRSALENLGEANNVDTSYAMVA